MHGNDGVLTVPEAVDACATLSGGGIDRVLHEFRIVIGDPTTIGNPELLAARVGPGATVAPARTRSFFAEAANPCGKICHLAWDCSTLPGALEFWIDIPIIRFL
jgi:hypothetical protein